MNRRSLRRPRLYQTLGRIAWLPGCLVAWDPGARAAQRPGAQHPADALIVRQTSALPTPLLSHGDVERNNAAALGVRSEFKTTKQANANQNGRNSALTPIAAGPMLGARVFTRVGQGLAGSFDLLISDFDGGGAHG